MKKINGWSISSDEISPQFLDFVSNNKLNTRWWMEECKPKYFFANFFRDFIYPEINHSPKRTCIDVGASYGFVTDALAQIYSNVHAFEVCPSTRDCLIENMKDYENVNIHHGAGSENKNIDVWQYEGFSGHNSVIENDPFSKIHPTHMITKTTGKIKTIDSLNITDLDLIKIDVERYEIEVLEGAKKTLLKNSPIVIIECLENLSEVEYFLTHLGYHRKKHQFDDHIFIK